MEICYTPELKEAWSKMKADLRTAKRFSDETGIPYCTAARIFNQSAETASCNPPYAEKILPVLERYARSSPRPADGCTAVPQIDKEVILIDTITGELSGLPAERLAGIYRAIVSGLI